jgi:hypothetical protein
MKLPERNSHVEIIFCGGAWSPFLALMKGAFNLEQASDKRYAAVKRNFQLFDLEVSLRAAWARATHSYALDNSYYIVKIDGAETYNGNGQTDQPWMVQKLIKLSDPLVK